MCLQGFLTLDKAPLCNQCETEIVHNVNDSSSNSLGGNGLCRRGDAANEKSSVSNLEGGEECYTETGDGTKVLVTKNRINILHIALTVNVQFEKTVTAGSNMFTF